jgi:hypothetical protein
MKKGGRTESAAMLGSRDLPCQICPRMGSYLNTVMHQTTPVHEVQLPTVVGIAKNFGNGYVASWTAGVDHNLGDLKFNASYVATAGIHMPRVYSPNSYGGACDAGIPGGILQSF